MPEQSLAARLRVAVGVLRGAERAAVVENRVDTADALRRLQEAVQVLHHTIAELDRTRAFVAGQSDADESRDEA